MTPGRNRTSAENDSLRTTNETGTPTTAGLAERFEDVRRTSKQLAEPLSPEDCALQSMPDASPVKWHLAHTSWFFETFVLEPGLPGYRRFHPEFRVLFNSYYNLVGTQHPRPERGLLSRPSLDEVLAYRRHVDQHVLTLLEREEGLEARLGETLEIGLNHEQQHQELILTDVKHLLSCNPLRPAYRSVAEPAPIEDHGPAAHGAPGGSWLRYDEGIRWIGNDGPGFSFDNEQPRHREFVGAFELASRPVTCGEYLAFIEDTGYARPELWLSDGWDAVRARGWRAPGYWEMRDGEWLVFTLGGLMRLHAEDPVCHVSFYEADAFARWAGARLSTEAEWELAAAQAAIEGNFLELGLLHPRAAVRGRVESGVFSGSGPGSGPSGSGAGPSGSGSVPSGIAAPSEHVGTQLQQLFGDVWEWTLSPYSPYPGYDPPRGALGEYNGKFMCNQLVLRGGSCATPRSHIRATYRNFFPPAARWQFSGIRLARDVGAF